MSGPAPTPASARTITIPAWVPAGPAEGWLTVGLVGLMAVIIGWSLDDPGWVTRRVELTDFLAPAALLGAAAGFLGAKAGLRRWVAHLASALIAAIVLPVLVGSALSDGGTPIDWFLATAVSTVEAWIDLAYRGRQVTQQLGHHLLAFGVIAWGTGQFAAFTVFGHRRPIDAATIVGLVLLTSMAATFRDQLHYLVAFSTAALLLLVRSHAMDEQTAWVRRRIGDPEVVRSLYLRGGTAFIVLAVLGSMTLTVTASSAPLQGIWADLPQRLADVSSTLQRYLPTGGARDIGAVSFGPSAPIGKEWTSSDAVVLHISVPRSEGSGKFYWRMAAYAAYDRSEWTWGPTEAGAVTSDTNVLAGLADDPTQLAARRDVTFGIEPAAAGYRGSLVISPQTVLSVSVDSTLTRVEPGGFYAALERGGTDGYTVTARIPLAEDVDGGLTKNRLRVAGTNYPVEVAIRYRPAPPPGTIGPEAAKLLADIKALAPALNPYDLAETIVRVLRDPNKFDYATDVTDNECGDRDIVECFAWSRRGFCQYYATTMAMLLRHEGIPARVVQGFLPGERDPVTGIETIRALNSHAWVEVYFPGYGWVDFDPTGGGRAQDQPLPDGRVIPPPEPTPSASLPLGTSGLDRETDPPVGGSTGQPPRSPIDQAGPFVAIAFLLALVFGALAFVVWQRGPRGEVGPDAAWRGIARLAARFGFGPRPSQTVFEYAGSLGEVLPAARPELQAVAGAKVQVAYGRQSLDADRLRAVRDASRRLRLALLRLAFRRGERWSKPRGRRKGLRRGRG